jgi:cell division protein FtsL
MARAAVASRVGRAGRAGTASKVGVASERLRARPGPARSKPRTQGRRKPKAKARRSPRGRVAGGTVWIALVALGLAGVVALNVAVLRLNVRFEELGRERAQLRAENAELACQIATRASSARIQTIARERLGLVPAAPDQWTYLDLRRATR